MSAARSASERIVITGLGVVAPNGIGKEEFWKNCAAGVSGIKRITLFDTSKYRCHWAGEISNFEPAKYLGTKGLRNLDRTTLLALVAAKLAIDDAKLEITDENRNEIGVVLGSTMGSVHSISEFDKEGLREGPRYVNPAHFPNTVMNSPASQVAIRFGLRGVNSTISTGFTAGVDALRYAMDMLLCGRARVLLVGGVEELCIQTFLGFYKTVPTINSLNGAKGGSHLSESQRTKTILGEGAAILVVELAENAAARAACPLAEILSAVSEKSPLPVDRYDTSANSTAGAITRALNEAGISSRDIDSFCASGTPAGSLDSMELSAIRKSIATEEARMAIGTVKSMIGESYSASAALQLAVAIGAFAKDCLPPTLAAGSAEQRRNSHTLPAETRQMPMRRKIPLRTIVNSYGPGGTAAAAVLEGL